MVYVVVMASISRFMYAFYTSWFYRTLIIISFIVIGFSVVYEIGSGNFCTHNLIVDIWTIITGIAYFMGIRIKYKYMVMWGVLFSQIMLALFVMKIS